MEGCKHWRSRIFVQEVQNSEKAGQLLLPLMGRQVGGAKYA